MRSADETAPEAIADLLNKRCRQAVRVATSPSADAAPAFAAALRREALEFAAKDGRALAAFLSALALLLEGGDLETAIQPLAEPFRGGLRAVAADIAATRTPPRPELAPEDVDAVAQLASRVATVLRARNRAGAAALAQALDEAGRSPGLDPDAGAYLAVLRGVLSGKRVQAQALSLSEPYRSAYFSLELLMKGVAPLGALLDRLQHNCRLVLASGNTEAQAALDAVLAELGARSQRGGPDLPEKLPDFLAALRRGLAGGWPAAVEPAGGFGDQRLDAVWEGLRTLAEARRSVQH